MNRKIMKNGPRGTCVSLPKEWTEKYNLSADDFIDCAEYGDGLLFKPISSGKKEITLDYTESDDKTTVWQGIVSAYIFGYDIIHITYPEEVIDLWNDNKMIPTFHAVQEICDDLLGVTIEKLEKDHARIKDVMGVAPEMFKVTLRRTLQLVQSFGRETYNGVKMKDIERLKFIYKKYNEARSHIRYCKRYLSKVGQGEKTSAYLDLVSKLEHIIVSFRSMFLMPEEKWKVDFSDEALEILRETIELLETACFFIVEPSVKLSGQIFAKRRDLMHQAELLCQGQDKYFTIYSGRLIVILNNILYITTVGLSMSLEGEKK